MRYHAIRLLSAWVGLFLFAIPAGQASAQELDCLVEPNLLVTMSFPLEGFIETVNVDRGDLVKRNQIIATMEASVEKANVEMARARYNATTAIKSSQVRVELGDRRVKRNAELFKDKIISGREMDDVETTKMLAELELRQAIEDRRVAKLELNRALASLLLRKLRSPFNGVVVERLLSPGEFSKQTPILKLAQIDPLRVEVFVPVSLLGKIQVGSVYNVRPEAPVGGSYPARVTVVDRVVDASSGTFGVRLELPNHDFKLPAGLKCKIDFPSPAVGSD